MSTCKDCRAVPIRTGQTEFRAGDFIVELCPVHSLTGRLAEALRGVCEVVGFNQYDLSMLAEYDRARKIRQI